MACSTRVSRRIPNSIQPITPRIALSSRATCRVHQCAFSTSPVSKLDQTRVQGRRSDGEPQRHEFRCQTQLVGNHRRPSLRSSAYRRGFPLRAFSTSSTLRLEVPRMSPDTANEYRREAMSKNAVSGEGSRSQVSSIRNLVRSQGTQKTLQDEFGLFPGTVIFPRGTNRPSIFSREMLKLLRLMVKVTFRDVMSRVVLRFQARPKPKRESKAKVVAAAKDLYERMNTALARGDLDTLSDICCGGLFHNLKRSIRARTDGTQYSWQLVKYSGRAAVSSSRATFIPLALTRPGTFSDDKKLRSFVRQIVVRLSSSQVLGEQDVIHGEDIANDAKVKKQEVEEFVVIQKATYRGVEGSWKIWGTIDGNMTVAQVEKAVNANRGTRQSLTEALHSVPT